MTTSTIHPATDDLIAALRTAGYDAWPDALGALVVSGFEDCDPADLAAIQAVAAPYGYQAEWSESGEDVRLTRLEAEADPLPVVVSYTLYDGDPDQSGGTELPDAEDLEIEADTLEDALDAVRDALAIYAAGLSAEDGYAPGDTLYALAWHEGGTERLTYTITAEDLGVEED